MINSVEEINSIKKKYIKGQLKIALLYPNKYQAGIESLAIQILYMLFNSDENIFCERVYDSNQPRSIETGRNLKDFDIIAVTFQYEIDYFNFINILIKSDIPIKATDRNKKPLIIAGGPCITENPIPLSLFIDIFILGEIEPVFDQLKDKLKDFIKEPKIDGFSDIPGVYLPDLDFYKSVQKNWVKDIDNIPYPTNQVLPIITEKDIKHPIAFGSSFLVEISRGCYRGCKFCLIGCQNLPYRERSLGKLKQIIIEGSEKTNRSRISFIGSAFSDYSKLEELLKFTYNNSFFPVIPSLRADRINKEIIDILYKSGAKSITMAPETASNRLHENIGKGLDTNKIIEAANLIIKNRIEKIKLYFIFGLPSETINESLEIVDLIYKISELGYKKRNISLSITPFIPKPHTEFQFDSQLPLKELLQRSKILKKELNKNNFKADFYDPKWARIQTVLSRGDQKISQAIFLTVKYGVGLGSWRRSIKELKINEEDYTGDYKFKNYPWKFIEVKPF